MGEGGRLSRKIRYEEQKEAVKKQSREYYKKNKGEINKRVCNRRRNRRMLEIDENQARPWDDPESLFCDGDFLTKPIDEGGLGINIRKGKECGDNK